MVAPLPPEVSRYHRLYTRKIRSLLSQEALLFPLLLLYFYFYYLPYLTALYRYHTITDMRTMNIVFDDETAKVLDKFPNKSQKVREAVRLYNGDTMTDTVDGLRAAFNIIVRELKEAQERAAELYEIVERMDRRLEEMSNR